MRRLYITLALTLLIVVGANVWATKYGSPQHIWFYCDMLGWCKP